MPYTPPAQQSPASSKTNSPTLSRAPSYGADVSGARSPTSSRPNLPRSISSATYLLSKQRRQPSFQSDASSFSQSPIESRLSGVANSRGTGGVPSSNGSIHQSPVPLNNLLIPTGAVLSPPNSSENSDGEADAPRGRELGRSWGELEQAVRSIELKRESSPERHDSATSNSTVSFSEPTTTIHSPTALSAEARKITHSRSTTETAIMIPERPMFSDSPVSEDSDDDEGELRIKPPLVRKKSGELVKPALRPSSRRRYSSMPGTPTYGKSVHFNDNGNQTRHFLQVDKPSAVSANSSPNETYESETEYPFEKRASSKIEWNIKLANFPEDSYERKSRPVRVERLFLSADNKMLIGTVAVANIAFQKVVVARFTMDYWKTTSEICADYDNDVRRQNPNDGCDRFTFSIRLADQAHLENKTLLLCIKYAAGGQEFWDNNDNMNYQIDFVKQMTKSASTTSLASPTSRQSLPRSRHSPPATSLSRDRFAPSDDELDSNCEGGSAYHFGSPDKITGDSSRPPIKLKPQSKRADLFRSGSAPSVNGLGGRYDFGASLSAALSSAQDKLGKQSGLMPHTSSAPRTGHHYFTRVASAEVKAAPVQDRPDSLTTDRPAMGSEQYKDLVQKFCYFTPGGSGKLSPPGSRHLSTTDGLCDSGSNSGPGSYTGSASPSPPQTMSPSLDGSNDCLGINTLASRSGSPGSVSKGNDYTSMNSLNFAYPYRQNGYLSDTLTPTAIRG